jgi:uncharacterized coiled-coil DUF342 family protein
MGMEKETDTDKILRAIAGVHERVDTVIERVDTLTQMVGALQGQMSSMETDIKTIKGDVNDVHKRIDGVEKLAERKVSSAEFNDRLRPIEEKLGIPSPN